MEEDLEILNEVLIHHRETEKVRVAIKHLIKEYKNLKEIEQIHRQENGELRKQVKELEEENEIIKGNYYTLSADIQMVTSKLGFPEDTIIADEMVSMIKENYIPIYLVKEMIEELNKQYDFYNSDIRKTKSIAKSYYIAIQKLQELLEKRK